MTNFLASLDRAKAMDRTVAGYVFLVTASGWLVYNVGLNLVGLDALLDLLDEANGAMELWPVLRLLLVRAFFATIASAGQALLQQFPAARNYRPVAAFLFGLMAADLALNAFGAYSKVMPLVWPPNAIVVGLDLIVTAIFNIGFQGVAHWIAKNVLFSNPEPVPSAAPRKTNASSRRRVRRGRTVVLHPTRKGATK